ncbi:DUF799 domain-containing protein [Oceanobacillus massiliensis]|uniref:DUF799 domain-containing protein n=1 Tax=Oceanobacillus massiliensis TaxID=1465765 RepID=UPI001F1CB802|nr:DUF799 domain-containing protein [Oceanobacillus massiliensis]
MASTNHLKLLMTLFYKEGQSVNAITASADFRSGQSLSAGTASASSEETHFLWDLQLLLFPLESTALRSNQSQRNLFRDLIVKYDKMLNHST